MAIIKNKDIYDHSKSELSKLTKDLDNLIKSEKELIKTNKALSESLQSVKKSNDGTEAKKLAEGTDKLTTSTRKLKNALTDEERVKIKISKANKLLKESRTAEAKQLAHIKQRTLEQNRALREQAKANLKVKKSTNGLVSSFKKLGSQLVGQLGIIAGITALVGVVKKGFQTFVAFEKANSKLAAVLGKTSKEISNLTKQQKALGSSTAFTASQVAGLQTELAKLGFTLKEIEASTPGILDLAAATGTDLAQSAEIAGATLRIFNLDASEMSRVTDVLALATSKSSLSMEKLATIMPTVGKTAQIAGVSLERTAALAGTLTDRGLDASTAGTALRNIFLKLAKDGRTWDGAMEEMNNSTDKLKTSIDLFGVRSSAAGIILSETSTDVDKLTVALDGADGAAKDMADTMLNNVAGDVTKAQSAIEGFTLSLIESDGVLSNMIRGVIQDFTEFMQSLTTFNSGNFVTQLKLIWNGLINITTTAIPGFNTMVSLIERITGKELPSMKFEIDEVAESTKKQGSALGFVNGLMNQQSEFIKKTTQELITNTDETDKNTKANEKLRKEKEAQLILDQEIREKREEDLILMQESSDLTQAISRADKEQLVSDQNAITGNFIETQQAQQAEILKTREEFLRHGAIIHEATAAAGEQIGELMAEGLLTFKSFGKILLKTTLDLIQRQVNIYLAGLLAREVGTKGAIGLGTFAILSLAINTALGAAKSAIQSFAEGGEVHGAGTGTSDSIPAMLSDGEFVVKNKSYSAAPDIINAVNDGLLTDSNIGSYMNKQDNNMMVAGLLMNMNDTNKQMLTALLNGASSYTRDGVTYLNGFDGTKENFIA